MAQTSPAGDTIQLAAGVVGDTVAQLERRIQARFGERGLTRPHATSAGLWSASKKRPASLEIG